MPDHATTEELLIHLQYISRGVDGINERLDGLNGRTRTNEADIAVLKDRTDNSRLQAQTAGRNAGRNWGVGAGAIISAIIAAIIQALKEWK